MLWKIDKGLISCEAGAVLSLSVASPFTEDSARMFLLVVSPSASPVETVAFGTFRSTSSKVMGYSSVVEHFLSIFKALGFTPALGKKCIYNACGVLVYMDMCI